MATGLTFDELILCPSSIRGTETPKVLRANFGDGYSQRAQDGLNPNARVFTLTWTGFSDADIQTLKDGFRALGGWQSIDWTPPKDTLAGKFLVPTWGPSGSRPSAGNLQATFQEVFDL